MSSSNDSGEAVIGCGIMLLAAAIIFVIVCIGIWLLNH